MTIQELLRMGRKELQAVSGDDAFLESSLLLAHILSTNREYLMAHMEETVADAQAERYSILMERRKKGEPVAYILGYKEFYGLKFFVNPSVLIPRPETEMVVEQVLDISKKIDLAETVFLDVGTGSGAIALCVGTYIPDATIVALDISLGALEVAKENKEALNIKNVLFVQSDLLANLPAIQQKTVIVMANLPYVAHKEHGKLDGTVRDFEPSQALVAKDDGLALYKKLFADITKKLKGKKVIVVFECDPRQIKKMKELARFTFANPEMRICKDLSGRERGGVIAISG